MNTILLIEDDVDSLAVTSRILTHSNYKVIRAENGKIGLEYIQKNGKNLGIILCDIMMPELDGYGVFNAYKNMPDMKCVPFVFLTASIEKDDIKKSIDMEADSYLAKPYTSTQLLNLISARIKKTPEIEKPRDQRSNEFANILFSPIGFTNKDYFTNKYQVKTIPKHNVLFVEGDKSFYMYYIIKGRVKNYKTNELGKEYITNIYKEGDFFGHCTLLGDEIHDESAMMLEDSEIVKFSKNDLLDLISNNKEACLKIMQDLSLLIKENKAKLISMAYNSARKKIADAVIFLAKKYYGNSSVFSSFPANRNDLSALSGISPESVSRTLTDFRKEGLIEGENGQLIIPNIQKLEALKN